MSTLKDYFSKHFQIDDASWNQLEAQITTRFVKKGTILLSPGTICEHAFFVVSGLLRMYSLDDNGKEHIIQFAPENWFIADRASLYSQETSLYFIDAVEDAEIHLIPANFNCMAADLFPGIGKLNEQILQNHIRQLQERINLLISANASQRYLAFVKQFPSLTLRVPQWMIASYLGITPEGLSRVRKELAHRNFKP